MTDVHDDVFLERNADRWRQETKIRLAQVIDHMLKGFTVGARDLDQLGESLRPADAAALGIDLRECLEEMLYDAHVCRVIMRQLLENLIGMGRKELVQPRIMLDVEDAARLGWRRMT